MDLWKRYTDYYRYYPEVGFALDISRVRFTEELFSNLAPQMDKAFANMQALEAGEKVNPDEGRMVGHYWLRAPELAPNEELKGAIVTEVNKIKTFVSKVHSQDITPEKASTFKNVIVAGIGGSALGPQLVYDAAWSPKNPMNLFFCDNTDPDGIQRTLQQIGDSLGQSLVLVVSKSGGTPETRNAALELKAAFEKQGLSFAKHAVAITCEGSKLDNQAKQEGWLEQCYMWDWVGGRTSVFAAVGLLPAALHGLDIDEFLQGAKVMDEVTRKAEMKENPAALLAMMWHSIGRGKGEKDMVILPYKDRLCLMSKYLQQLVMESLGKEKDLDGQVVNQGIAVYGNKGSTDQHAYVQQLREGVNNFFVTFIEVLADYTELSEPSGVQVENGVTSGDFLSGFLQGTRRALYENERDSITITLDQLNTFSLGALIALYERAVGIYASLVNVNAYHQPGVEAGKKAAARVIELQHAVVSKLSSSSITADELSQAMGQPEEAETVYKILEHLAANKVIKREGPRHPLQARFQKH